MSDDLGQILTDDLTISITVNAKDQTIRVAGDQACTYLQMITAIEAAYAAVMKEAQEKVLDTTENRVVH